MSAWMMVLLSSLAGGGGEPDPTLRVATFNTSLFFDEAGGLIEALQDGDHQRARQVAAIIQRVRPDLVLLNEFDYDPAGRGADLFVDRYLGHGQFGETAIDYPYRYTAPVNTGVSSGVDLDGDGEVTVPPDAHGWGRFPGQYGMLVLSRHPIRADAVRSFRSFRWIDLPGAWLPQGPDGSPYYSEQALAALRLSSKSHWDVPVEVADRTVHFLVSHPTPPVFDGEEDRNGRRNHDEIRFWALYLDDAPDLVDDDGHAGGLPEGKAFVIAGDLNADPEDGDSSGNPMALLLNHARVDADSPPTHGGVDDGSGRCRGREPTDTADFGDAGCLRVDYVLPSRGLERRGGGVFWPARGEPGAEWLEASDHRLVWLDLGL